MSPLLTLLTTITLLATLTNTTPLTPSPSPPQTLHKWSSTTSPTCASPSPPACRPDCVTAFSSLCANTTLLSSTTPQTHTVNNCTIYYHNNITTTSATTSFEEEGRTQGKGAQSFCLGQFLTIVDPSPRDPRQACNASKVSGVLEIGSELVYAVYPEGGDLKGCFGEEVGGLIEGGKGEEGC